MKYDALLNAGKIKIQRVSEAEIEQAMSRAERDLKTARSVMAGDWDWGFAIAYNAVLQASRAFMFAEGYRPDSREGHKNTFAFMHVAMGKPYEDLIKYFDRVRNKRNQAIYDVAGIISETEAQNLFKMAVDFVALVKKLLKEKKQRQSSSPLRIKRDASRLYRPSCKNGKRPRCYPIYLYGIAMPSSTAPLLGIAPQTAS